MTLVADPVAAEPDVRRLWKAPLWAHLAVLAVGLLALMPFIGTGSSFSADEGAAIIQARSLSRGDGWIVEHPVPEADPARAAYPLELSEWGQKGVAPFGKHPLYALMLAGADRVAGVAGMVALSVLGTVAAAGLAALLAGRIDPALARPTLWVAGVASPLFFDGYLVIAHTLGAACAAGAVLAAAVAFERRSRVYALAVLPCVIAAVLLRTEAAFLALGLAAAAVVVGFRRDRLVAGLVAASSLLAGFAGRALERAWIGHIVGGPVAGGGPTSPIPTAGFLADRKQAFVLTWLRPSYDASRTVDLLLVLVLGGLLFAAYTVRRHRPGTATGVGVAGAAALLALVLDPTNIVPGLLITCPVAVAGLALAGRSTFASPAARLAGVTAAVFAAGVVATQYATGGSGEWGGRYFALALPVALPLAVYAIRACGSRPLVVGVVASSLALGAMGVGSLRASHQRGAGFVAALDRAAGPGRPVMVTTIPLVPRMAWPTFDRQRWLLSKRADLATLVDRLGPAGVQRFTFVTRDASDLALLPPGLVRESATTYANWQILVLRTS